ANRKSSSIKFLIGNRCFGSLGDIDANNAAAKKGSQVVRDVPVATTDVEHPRAMWNTARNLEGHIVAPGDLASPPLASPTAHQTPHKTIKSFAQISPRLREAYVTAI
ncbi:MAG TPA: hypothetical protein VFR80_09760, partial [Pyrinomonadaceae bacterium]|nr:hypothetical protein [Pyrinomonadaceae bacterium]